MLYSASFIFQAHVMKRSVFFSLYLSAVGTGGTDQIFHRSLLLIITKRHHKKIDGEEEEEEIGERMMGLPCLHTHTRRRHIPHTIPLALSFSLSLYDE